MKRNNELKVHILNVNHGDATILEFPDYGNPPMAHFGIIDLGAKRAADRGTTTRYMRELLVYRQEQDPNINYEIDFVCVTHPHDDHYGGLTRFMNEFSDQNPANNKIKSFWDCGFRTNSIEYNAVLNDISLNDNIDFIRVAAGAEFKFGMVQITILAPSVDLRNRFDTFGIGKNDASIVVKIKYNNSYIILPGDAEFASWGKSTEEFPRKQNITLYKDALGLSERQETSDQLKCDLFRLSHHGSKHGTSFEYMERLKPNRIVVSAGSDQWYQAEIPKWQGDFPHPLTSTTIQTLQQTLGKNIDVFITGETGHLIFNYSGNVRPRNMGTIDVNPGDNTFQAKLDQAWS